MEIKEFNNHGLDRLGIHWMQYLSMTLISLLIFLIGLDKAVPSFHHFVLSLLFFSQSKLSSVVIDVTYPSILFLSPLITKSGL